MVTWLYVSLVLALCQLPVALSAAKTRVVTTKYGKVQGLIRHLGDLLGDVEIFMGVPYASPPIDEYRFTPTNTPTPWDGVFDATNPPPVCPQLIPNENEDVHMPKARADFIKRVASNLVNQSEDCLTLTIYSPIMIIPKSEVYPVIVYIHGESFSWGAGSLYDGSVLAAYGRVVVVTVNYRLGPLGFLNTYGGGGGGVVSNFALLDQIAALNWVAENIENFSGDKSKVTLMGRDTGAACISYLMESPIVPPDLFQRVVLMSGGSWCPWSHVTSPLSVTLRLAVATGCPVPEEPGLPSPLTVLCLRNATLGSLMSASRTVRSPAFTPVWGPSEDGVVVATKRGVTQLSRSQKEIIFAFTPWEAWSWVDEDIISKGIDELSFERITRTWVRNTRKHHLREVLAVALQEYKDWTASSPSPLTRRDMLLNMLGDSGVVSPLHKAADDFSRSTKVFMFLCDLSLQTHGQIQQPGWELGLLWGTSLSDVSPSPGAPSPPLGAAPLTQLSEEFITLITNFAKSGDPNLPRESPSPGFAAISCPEYTKETRKFLRIGVPPSVSSQYRAHQLAIWSWLVPELENAGTHYPADPNSWEHSSDPSLFYGSVRPPDPWYFLNPTSTTSTTTSHTSTTTYVIEAAPVVPTSVFGTGTPRLTTTLDFTPTLVSPSKKESADSDDYVKYSTALMVTVSLGVSLILLNGLVCLMMFWKRSPHNCENSHHQQQQSVMTVPRVGSVMSLGNGMVGGSYGAPSDCVKSSYEKLHLTTDELQRLTRNPYGQTETSFTLDLSNLHPLGRESPSSTTAGVTRGLYTITDVADINRGLIQQEQPQENRSRSQSNTNSLNRRPQTPAGYQHVNLELQDCQENIQQHRNDIIDSTPMEFSDPPIEPLTMIPEGKVEENEPQQRSETRVSFDIPCTRPEECRRPNGWAQFAGEVPDPPPPPRTATIRREMKKSKIYDEAIQRL